MWLASAVTEEKPPKLKAQPTHSKVWPKNLMTNVPKNILWMTTRSMYCFKNLMYAHVRDFLYHDDVAELFSGIFSERYHVI